MLINTFHGKQDHTVAKIYKFYNRTTTTKIADSEWCGAVNAMVVKNVKDVPLKLLPLCRKIWLQENLTFIRITFIMPFKT